MRSAQCFDYGPTLMLMNKQLGWTRDECARVQRRPYGLSTRAFVECDAELDEFYTWMNSTLCDVKRDLAVPLRRDVSIAHAFISRGEETTDWYCLFQQGPHQICNLLYSKRALYLHFSAIRPEASMFDDGWDAYLEWPTYLPLLISADCGVCFHDVFDWVDTLGFNLGGWLARKYQR